MPSVTYDGRSFKLDGRRKWLVSGAIQYARIPEPLWASRIHAAKLAGLNCVETPVVWREHEPRAGAFDFDGQRNIRRFLELVHNAGMVAILRVGPYVGSSLEFGGLPAWLKHVEGAKLRVGSQPFLEACGRYLLRLCEEVKDLQVTATGGGGPIILVQNESRWECGSSALADGYLRELARFLREGGINVPTVNTNNLWQGVEGEIDAWSSSEELLATCRQLTEVRPDQPRFVMDLSVTGPSLYGEEKGDTPEPAAVQRRLVEAMAGLGQFNIDPFCGGTNIGFLGGALPNGASKFVTQSNDRDAPLSETGRPGSAFGMVRNACMFASTFGHVLAHADPDYRPVAIDPTSAGGGKDGGGISTVHVQGEKGGCVFLFNADPKAKKSQAKTARLLGSRGSQTDVYFGEQACRWLLHGVNLTSRTQLTETNLDAVALVGDTLVLCGPDGTPGFVSINDSPIDVDVPKGKDPEILEHEGLTIVVAGEKQMSRIMIDASGVYLNASWIDSDGAPVSASAAKSCVRIGPDGKSETVPATPGRTKADKAPALASWEHSDVESYLDGTSPRYATIDGPAELSRLGAADGYGWYRMVIRSGAAKRAKAALPRARDRVHLFADGKPIGLVGVGAGASSDTSIPLKRGDVSVVALADNMGRQASGSRLGEFKGIVEHLMTLTALKGVKSAIIEEEPIDLLKSLNPLWEIREGDTTTPEQASITFMHRKKSPLVLRIDNPACRAAFLINGEVDRFIDAGDFIEIVLDSETLKRGSNTLALAPVEGEGYEDDKALTKLLKDLAGSMHVLEGTAILTEKAEWAFAKWEQPAASLFDVVSKAKLSEHAGGAPSWWRCRFESPESAAPLMLDLAGMTKGQVYLNGRHLGRYWVRTAEGEEVPPQKAVWLPECWLDRDNENELVLFDEHGGDPGRCKLVFAVGSAGSGD